MDWLRIGGLLAAIYLVAAIPFGYLMGRARGVDMRTVGSGNIGATNVLSTQGKLSGLITLLLDIVKGAAGVAAARWLLPEVGWLPGAAALVAVVGHCFPVYLGFRGGKGVATAIGAYLVVSPPAALAALLLFVAVVAATRIVSAGSMLAAGAYPLLAWALASPQLALASIPTSGIILWRHRGNLARIREGTERKLGESRLDRGEG